MVGDYPDLKNFGSDVFRHAKIQDISNDFWKEKWFFELQSYHPWAIAGLQNGELSKEGIVKSVSRECFHEC